MHRVSMLLIQHMACVLAGEPAAAMEMQQRTRKQRAAACAAVPMPERVDRPGALAAAAPATSVNFRLPISTSLWQATAAKS
jgi:hypothetical protein